MDKEDRSGAVRRSSNDPAVYLRQRPEPDSDEQVLIDQLGLHHGAPVPAHMLAKVAVRVHRQSVWISRFDALRRKIRRHMVAAVALLASNLVAFGGYWIHVHDADVADRESFIEYRKATEGTLEELRKDIRELRSEVLRRLGMVSPAPPEIRDILGSAAATTLP